MQLVFVIIMISCFKDAFVQDLKAPPRMSKPLVVFFVVFQFLFGFNFGFVKQMNKYKIPAQTFSVTTGIIVSVFVGYSMVYNLAWITYVLQYFLTFLILMVTKYTFYELISDLNMVKIEIQQDQDYFDKYIGTITWTYSFLMFWIKFILGIFHNWNITEQGPYIFRLLVLILILGLDSIPIIISLVFYQISAKLKHLCLGFSSNNGVLEVQAKYKTVLDLLDKVRPTTDNLIVLGFLTDCPKWILSTWFFLILLKKESWMELGCSYAYALHLTLQMCLPAVCAELMQVQADELSLLVHERLLVEQDESTRATLSQLARYIRARPPLRKAWRLLPPGLQLPIAMLSVCATQLIVIIQFTHLYD